MRYIVLGQAKAALKQDKADVHYATVGGGKRFGLEEEADPIHDSTRLLRPPPSCSVPDAAARLPLAAAATRFAHLRACRCDCG